MNPEVDWFFDKDTKWQKEYGKLRTIVLDCGLTEQLKWGVPCYTFHENNVVLIHGFKDYCALLFHKGVLLGDPEKFLIQQTENVQAARQMRFIDVKEIKDLESIIKAYIFEAIEVEKSGAEVKMKKTSEFEMPQELKQAFKNDSELESAFFSLTPGRQRSYLLYFSQAKQSKTRAERIKKSTPKIFKGEGYNEK